METKNCQNCKKDFTIETEDFDFYEKIKVPAPTFCPECRRQRRLAWRNERSLYKRKCELCDKSIVSMHNPKSLFTVFCKECWWGDGWDPISHGKDYDFSKSFFTQFQELLSKTPRPNLIISNTKESDYCNYVADAKNCYLCFGSIEIEDCSYGSPYESKNCVDTFLARECEYCYECIDCEKLSLSIFSQDCSNSFGLVYCFDCKNCQDCIGCVGLRNKNYYIYNVQYTKEEFLKKKEDILKKGRPSLNNVEKFFNQLKSIAPHRFATILQSVDITGDHIVQSKNIRDSFDIKNSENCHSCMRMIDGKDTGDTNYCEYLEQCYEYIGFWKNNNVKLSNTCGVCTNVTYSDFCSGSQNIFGCVGLRTKEYCILNRQYSKEEYETLVPKIIEHMNEMPYIDKKERIYKYGEFFPYDISPFAYNETIAQEYFPLSKEEATAHGFDWYERGERNYQITIKNEKIPQTINEVDDEFLNEIIECAGKGDPVRQCTQAFRLIPQEIQLYRKLNIPIPTYCYNCRHYNRLQKRNPMKLWHRRCMCKKEDHGHNDTCTNEFETTYSPDRPEIIYCEKCYQKEVI